MPRQQPANDQANRAATNDPTVANPSESPLRLRTCYRSIVESSGNVEAPCITAKIETWEIPM